MRGERLTKLRQERHISQRELGEIVSVSGYTISAYELDRSDPSDDIKMRIAEYFDVSVDYRGPKMEPAGVSPGPGPGLGRGKCNGVKNYQYINKIRAAGASEYPLAAHPRPP